MAGPLGLVGSIQRVAFLNIYVVCAVIGVDKLVIHWDLKPDSLPTGSEERGVLGFGGYSCCNTPFLSIYEKYCSVIS